MHKLNIEKPLLVQYLISLGTLALYDILAIINVILIFFPMEASDFKILWCICALDACCITYVFVNFAWMKTHYPNYYRKTFDYPVTMIAIAISLGAVSVGSFVLWIDKPSIGPEVVHRILGYTFLTTWWYLQYCRNPPIGPIKWRVNLIFLITMGVFQGILLMFSFIWVTKAESSVTITEIGAAAYLVSIFENVLLVELFHLAYEAITRTFEFEEESEDSIFDELQPAFTKWMNLILGVGLIMLFNLIIAIICLILREVYFESNMDAIKTIQIIQLCLIIIFATIIVVVSIYVGWNFKKIGYIDFPKSHVIGNIGTLAVIGVFFIGFIVTDINSLDYNDNRTILDVFKDGIGLSFLIIWWFTLPIWHFYISQHSRRKVIFQVLLRVLILVLGTYVILYVTSNLLHESTTTVEKIPVPSYLNSVCQNILLFELLHLASVSKDVFRYNFKTNFEEHTPLLELSAIQI